MALRSQHRLVQTSVRTISVRISSSCFSLVIRCSAPKRAAAGIESAHQLALGECWRPAQTLPAKERLVAAHTRREPQPDAAVGEADSVPFFDEARVPVQTIELPDLTLKDFLRTV